MHGSKPSQKEGKPLRLSDKDFEFLVETVAPETTDKIRLKQISGRMKTSRIHSSRMKGYSGD